MKQHSLKFSSFYNMPGEGVVCELTDGQEQFLYDIKGLEYRILKLKQNQLDSSQEESVLFRLKALNSTLSN